MQRGYSLRGIGLIHHRAGNHAASSAAKATPKLRDICWAVLLMLEALLALVSLTSAKVSVFMLVNCSEEKKPCVKLMMKDDPDRCATGLLEREKGDGQADDDRVEDQNGAVAEAGQQRTAGDLHANGGKRPVAW